MSDDIRLLPPNSTALEKTIVGAAELDRVRPEVIARLWNPDTCPAAALPWLAWALSVDEWEATWDEPTQRRVIAASIDIHRHKGTVSAVRAALRALGHTGQIIEWWQQDPPGHPYTFLADVEIDSRGLDIETQIAIERQITAVKPARSHFAMRLIASTRAVVHLASTAIYGEDITVYPYITEETDAPSLAPHIGIGSLGADMTSIYPQG